MIRLSQRLGWTKRKEPEKIEKDLVAILPRKEWDHSGARSHLPRAALLLRAQARMRECFVNDVSPCAFDADHVGTKPKRVRTLPVQT